MSPTSLRRFRAERLLRAEFDALKGRVLASVRARLRSVGVPPQVVDLEACYAEAWQGLYSILLSGQEVHNPAAWLSTVAFRRAIDEHRRTAAAPSGPLDGQEHVEVEIAQEIEHRARLRQVMEGIAVTMTKREREAASLCYLQGLSREQAAAQMGLTARSMRRLMEGRGSSAPGVAAKLAELTKQIAADRFCTERSSLMRAYAFGVLDPEGERHRVATAHWRQCPACRAYVRSLRGLAALLPPVLLGLPPAALSPSPGGRARRAASRTASPRMRSVLRQRALSGGAAKLRIAGAVAVLGVAGAFGVGRELSTGAPARLSANGSSQGPHNDERTPGARSQAVSLAGGGSGGSSSRRRAAQVLASRAEGGASSAGRRSRSSAWRAAARPYRPAAGASIRPGPRAGSVREFGIERRAHSQRTALTGHVPAAAPAGASSHPTAAAATGAAAEFGVE